LLALRHPSIFNYGLTIPNRKIKVNSDSILERGKIVFKGGFASLSQENVYLDLVTSTGYTL